ncbi:class I SAM-dependent methyltransferase [Ekhidna sp.]|uniref:class I SAM-dependent methyltransferase n=1 Tax=Ekhidna sp. TaxID=2608089 RepID=UPI0035167311
MYEKIEECPVCKHTQFDNHLICDDHSVSGESFALVKCTKCQLIFTNPRPAKDHIIKYYQSDQYISHTDNANSPIHFIYKLVRTYTLRQKLSLVNQYSKKGSILDYGCGTGDFLKLCNKNNWQAFGYEPDEAARSISIKKNPRSIVDSIDKLDTKLDVITAWHVIEHVHELNMTIKSLKGKLKDGGYLFMAVPNHKSFDAEHYKEYWAAYDVPRHLYHFDQDSMKSFASHFKLKLVDTLPMKFDSYYVSMLSEKYKNGGNLLSSIRTGFQSNQSAKKTNNYSSLIYILQK